MLSYKTALIPNSILYANAKKKPLAAIATPTPTQNAAPSDPTARKAALVDFDGDVPEEDAQQ